MAFSSRDNNPLWLSQNVQVPVGCRSPPFSEAMTLSPRAGTVQSCHAEQEGLSTASSSSSSPFLLIHRQKSRRNLLSTILHLLKPRGPTGNPELLKLLIFFPTNPIKTQSKVSRALQPKLKANVHCLIRRWKTNKWIRCHQSIWACFAHAEIGAGGFPYTFGCVPASIAGMKLNLWEVNLLLQFYF